MYQFECNGLTIVALSDTHGSHRDIIIPQCDLLIHVGDACDSGNQSQLTDFFCWLSEQNARYKIFVAGNHDLPFALHPQMAEEMVPADVLFLQNRIVELEGVVIAGIEATPYMFYDTVIDESVDIIVSHGAPQGILGNDGCEKLFELISTVKPTFALFGHIHSPSQRFVELNGTQYINVSQ